MYLEYFETTAEDYMDHCHWNEAIKQKMQEPVAANGYHSFDSKQAQRMIDLSWFENPRSLVKISVWDEATKRKMREPVLPNGNYRFDVQAIRNMIEFAWS